MKQKNWEVIHYTEEKPEKWGREYEAKILLNDFFKIEGINKQDFEKIIGEAETLAGLILELKGEIPVQETEITYKNYHFKIVSADKRRIKSIKLSILPKTEPEDEQEYEEE